MVSTVSTRGVKFKFSEGEKVLCYEPDPTKAKVLYDSKVLELNVSRDSRGRKVPEYLIHFFGWSSSWDRCVKEEFILPNTEENRVLQAKLAQEAAAYLKGKRKSKLPPMIKESLQKIESTEEIKEPEATMARNEEADSSESCGESSDEEQQQRPPINIKMPDPLKIKLVDDNFNIVLQNKLIRLPSELNIVMILEDYVKYVALKLLSPNDTGSKAGTNIGMSIPTIKSKINFTKEAMDGIRLYFDFTLPHLLLYRQEKKQFYTQGSCCSPIKPKRPTIAIEENAASTSTGASTSTAPSSSGEQMKSATSTSPSHTVTRSGLRNQSTSQKSPLSPQKVEEPSTSGHKGVKNKEIGPPNKKLRILGSREGLRSRLRTKSMDENTTDVANVETPSETDIQAHAHSEPAASPPSPPRQTRRSIQKEAAASQATPAPAIQVNKSPVSSKKNSSVSTSSTASSSNLVTPLSVCLSPLSLAAMSFPGTSSERNEKSDETVVPNIMSPHAFLVSTFCQASIKAKQVKPEQTPESLLREVLQWRMLPDYMYDYKPASPSLIYGGAHLLRLFVKLGDLLYKSSIPMAKMKPLLELIDEFLQYLIERKDELVDDKFYVNASEDEFVQQPLSSHSSRAV